MKKAVFCWSGGKDSAYCLHKVLSEKEYHVKYLLTTIHEKYRRISMHGIREELLEQQAKSIHIPLIKIYIKEGTNKEYESKMKKILLRLKEEGINNVIFGDIFLEDLREYRVKNIKKVNMNAVFPLWKLNTSFIINDFILNGFETIICCINNEYLNDSWIGMKIDKTFINKLPGDVDPCGENGEFHTFCFSGPVFKNKINFKTGDKVYKPLEINTKDGDLKKNVKTKGFWYIDLIPD